MLEKQDEMGYTSTVTTKRTYTVNVSQLVYCLLP